MAEKSTDVIAIGNAIVDIIGRCDDAFLERHNAQKGHMHLIDAEVMAALYADMGPGIETSGGSAANTVVGISSFGGRTAFIGKVADDDFGKIFAHDIKAAGVDFPSKPIANGRPTSKSLILVTPDGERTMNTYLGISVDLDNGEVDPDAIAGAKIVYLEGYLFDQPEAKQAFSEAVSHAQKSGTKVALSLSDGFCVDRHRDEFRKLVKDGVDVLFANESEIKSLYQTDDFDEAVRSVVDETHLAALTRGGSGSVVVTDEGLIQIPVMPQPAGVVDTTGAGDLYAAGFLYGLSSGRSYEISGKLGSLAAGEVISHLGARPEQSLEELAKKSGLI